MCRMNGCGGDVDGYGWLRWVFVRRREGSTTGIPLCAWVVRVRAPRLALSAVGVCRSCGYSKGPVWRRDLLPQSGRAERSVGIVLARRDMLVGLRVLVRRRRQSGVVVLRWASLFGVGGAAGGWAALRGEQEE